MLLCYLVLQAAAFSYAPAAGGLILITTYRVGVSVTYYTLGISFVLFIQRVCEINTVIPLVGMVICLMFGGYSGGKSFLFGSVKLARSCRRGEERQLLDWLITQNGGPCYEDLRSIYTPP